MDLFTAKSDLDLSVNFGNKASEFSREKKIQRLRKFAKKLYALQRTILTYYFSFLDTPVVQFS